MLRSILVDLAFLGFGGAPLISTISVQGGLVSLAIGVLATFAHNAVTEAPRSRKSDAGFVPVDLRAASA